MAVSLNLRKFDNINILFEGSNGLETFQYVQQNMRKKKIQFILLDLDMPIMNGYEAC